MRKKLSDLEPGERFTLPGGDEYVKGRPENEYGLVLCINLKTLRLQVFQESMEVKR